MTKSMKLDCIGTEIWEQKYRYQGNGGVPSDQSFEDSWRRVAKASAKAEKNPRRWEKRFYDILEDFKFLPGGRILANAGTSRSKSTMFNCFVMNRIKDSLEGIFDTVKESALTQKQGGGVGYDFSTLRPKGSSIQGCESESSGPVSFMRVLDSTCQTIMSAGHRRGAQMAVMSCEHPDIEEFITAKRGNNALRMFNLSVGVTSSFIRAVKENREWELTFDGEVHKTVHAVELWELIMKSTYEFAEPGFVLLDRINEMNNLHYCEEIRATNPCGELPLPPYGACLLGSINLTKFVKDAFKPKCRIDLKAIADTTKIAVRLLDNIIDVSAFPLEAQELEAKAKRRMGIGVTGLADAFIMLGIRYGEENSIRLAEDIMRTIKVAAYESSVELAKEKGAFQKFDADAYLAGKFVATLPPELRDSIRENGLRNSHLTAIAPTGTISLLAGNVSSGLEPVFAFKYNRQIRLGSNDGDKKNIEVTDYAYREYSSFKRKKKIELGDLPEYFVTTDDVKPEQHLLIQAALQKHVDSSISKTINVPKDFPFDQFKNIYLKAFELGLKGCTTFRPSDQISGILQKKDEKGKKDDKTPEAGQNTTRLKRPSELEGSTYKIKTPFSAEALYVTINDIIERDGRRRPYELFINTKNLQHYSWIVAMTRLVSAIFRREPDTTFLVEELKSIYDPNGGYFSEGQYIPSMAADIGRVIETHLNKIGMLEPKKSSASVKVQATDKAKIDSGVMFCPQCNEKGLIAAENCVKCLNCDYSRCS